MFSKKLRDRRSLCVDAFQNPESLVKDRYSDTWSSLPANVCRTNPCCSDDELEDEALDENREMYIRDSVVHKQSRQGGLLC